MERGMCSSFGDEQCQADWLGHDMGIGHDSFDGSIRSVINHADLCKKKDLLSYVHAGLMMTPLI